MGPSNHEGWPTQAVHLRFLGTGTVVSASQGSAERTFRMLLLTISVAINVASVCIYAVTRLGPKRQRS